MFVFRLVVPLFFLLTFLGCQPRQQVQHDYPWSPTRPIQVIVPWAAGGSTDQVVRLLAGEIESALGQSVVVVNQPGASGSIGTRNALQARPDGYTWTSGSAASLGTYPVLGMLDTGLDDWHIFLAVANVEVVSVNPNTPYQDFDQLMQAFRDRPGQVTVATAGTASNGHTVMESLVRTTGISYRHAAYQGGNPAVIAAVGGEAQVVTQFASEQAEMIRGGLLRPLAVVSDEPLEIEGHGIIAPITDWLPEYPIAPSYFGIWVRKGVPEEVLDTMRQIWDEHIGDSEILRRYARTQGAILRPLHDEAAVTAVMPKVKVDSWTLFEAGQARVSPETFGIPRP